MMIMNCMKEAFESNLKDKISECSPGLEVIKLEYGLILKIKRIDWLLVDTCPQPIIALYFEFGNELKFYNLEVRPPDKSALLKITFF